MFLLIAPIIGAPLFSRAQSAGDTLNAHRYTIHFQTTVLTQYHPAFHAAYSGANSLSQKEETPTSLSATLFLGSRLWKGAELYCNPELSGGSGFSKTLGVAGFPNGEVYRVDNPTPKIYLARLYLKQIFPLSHEWSRVEDGPNQVASKYPTSYLALYAGKFSMLDFFDANCYSHDPRTQFFNWTLMGNGAWDYPANTRGYTNGLALEWVRASWAVRMAAVMVPISANGSAMDSRIGRSGSEAIELDHSYSMYNQKGRIRIMGYLTQARMGNYHQALLQSADNHATPSIDAVRAVGRTKYGFGINFEQPLGSGVGLFSRAGWNDGHNETWAFTEVDRHLSLGLSLNGSAWSRPQDTFAIATLVNGLSKDHREYLSDGGYGFIIGDGALHYGLEQIAEVYYSFRVKSIHSWFSPDYQFILHPAYNKDRGPVHVFGLRLHVEI